MSEECQRSTKGMSEAPPTWVPTWPTRTVSRAALLCCLLTASVVAACFLLPSSTTFGAPSSQAFAVVAKPPLEDIRCGSESWHLKGMNWTDGGEGEVTLPMCTPPGTHVGGLEKCPGAIASPKVALMFLTRGMLPHAGVWEAWLNQAADLLPVDCIYSATCSGDREGNQALFSVLDATCGDGVDCISRQHLFSVYIHVPHGLPVRFPPTARWASHVIAERVKTAWGGFTLVDAARALLNAALENPLNQRFILVSESDLPLYSPDVVYTQLMYSPLSRINACDSREDWGLDKYRWTYRFSEETDGQLGEHAWRKSHQWAGLIRKHARAVVDDVHIAKVMEKHCYSGQDPDFDNKWRTCFADEHYIPVLLHLLGWDEETDCMGELTHTVFCRGDDCNDDERLHPRTYNLTHLDDADFLLRLRKDVGTSVYCAVDGALATAANLIRPVRETLEHLRIYSGGNKVQLLNPRCPLLARKFPDTTAPAALRAANYLLAEDAARHRTRHAHHATFLTAAALDPSHRMS